MCPWENLKKPNLRNELLMILEGATSQVQLFVSYSPVYCLEKFSHMYSVFNKVHPKMPIRLWTFWSWSQCRYFYGTLSSKEIYRETISEMRKNKSLIWFIIYLTISVKCLLGLGLATLQGTLRKRTKRKYYLQ